MTATVPETWTLVEAIAERFRSVKVDNGYRTDAGLDVVTEHAEVKEKPASPQLLVFLDGELKPADSSSSKWRDYAVPITTQCKFPLTYARAQRTAHEVMADLNQVFPADAAQLTVNEFKLIQDSLLIAQRPNGKDVVVVEMTLLASIRIETRQ